MPFVVKSPRKLIEVALPLDAINAACVREKSIRHGHPSTLHLWWARRPLAAARAVIFAQMVNDPGTNIGRGFKYGKNKKEAAIERKQLFKIIEDLVIWDNTTNEQVLSRARAEILRSWREVCDLNKDHPQAAALFNPDKLPPLHDPFAGGGTIPLEAQRLGMEAYASDLNPVAVLINKAMIEIPPKFSGCPPVNPEARRVNSLVTHQWNKAEGLAEDVRYYGALMRKKAEERIGYLYKPVEITTKMAVDRADLKPLIGEQLTVIAWLWARTVKSPNPAFSDVDVPLASTFVLGSKEGKEAYVQPVVKGNSYYFTVKIGKPPLTQLPGTTAGKRKAFRCLMSDVPIDYDYIREEGKAGRMGHKLMAVVAEGRRGSFYLAPTAAMEELAAKAKPTWKPEMQLPNNPRDFKTPNYGLTTYGDLFTPRQLVALTTFSDLVAETCERIKTDAKSFGLSEEGRGIEAGGTGAQGYAEAVAVFLGLAVGRSANYWSAQTTWGGGFIVQTFGRQALPMVWDYSEANPFSSSTGNWTGALEWITNVITNALPTIGNGVVTQADAQTQEISRNKVVSTDPPYYDNIGYAELSDFFYVWQRRTLQFAVPNLFSTLATPKSDELVATPYRHGGKEAAERFFLDGMTMAMRRLADLSHPAFPVTIYYAFKQSETQADGGTTNTGWDTFLEAVVQAGFSLSGTWPMRTERDQGLKTGSNVLASSIILVCRKRSEELNSISRREFQRELNAVLPEALDEMTKGSGGDRSPVAPVDLSQAIIGPGMAVFSKYAAVLEADGSSMSVRTALQLINRFLAEDDFDHDTQFCLHWFEQHGWNEGPFGDAETLSRAKGTSVDGVKEAGVIQSGGGKVRLLKWSEYPKDWDSQKDTRLPVWEALHQLIRALKQGGEPASGALLSLLGGKAEAVRQLAYRLYTLCERLGQAEDARAYNELITSWAGIESAAGKAVELPQLDLFGESQ